MSPRNHLVMLIALGRQFRSTPIVDDEFPLVRDTFDATLRTAEDYIWKTRDNDPDGVYDFFRFFWQEQSEWSQRTFGSDQERGPLGAVKHLQKEAEEVEKALGTIVGDDLLEEFVDCLFLTLDGARRSGFTVEQFIAKTWEKLEKNKARQWQTPTSNDAPIEHVR